MKKDQSHLNLLCDVSDLAALLAGSEDVKNFLQQTVELVNCHMSANVCTIYLLDEENEELVMEATIGLNPLAVGRVRMKVGVGLVGATLERREPINEGFASRNPQFKYFEEAAEDRFNSFLGVPILKGFQRIGVLVVQHERPNHFDDRDVLAMRAISSQLANAIGNARFLIDPFRYTRPPRKESMSDEHLQFVKGIPVSGGYAMGHSMHLGRNYTIQIHDDGDADAGYTLADFQRAMQATINQIREMQTRLSERLLESASLIFTAHIMMLKDAKFVGEITSQIQNNTPVVDAIRSVAGTYISRFSSSSHPLVREKATDVKDLAGRLLANLRKSGQDSSILFENCVVIAKDLYPSHVMKVISEDVKGLVLVSGGVTSHVSILARSLQLPMIIADRPELLEIPDGTPILMDAEMGNIYVRPSDRVVKQFESQKDTHTLIESLASEMTPVTETTDGRRIRLLANINLLRDLILAHKLKAEGIGLYRTEFPFLIRSAIPSEEEQYTVYKRLFDGMGDKPVTIRTLDLGGDKVLNYEETTRESNPDLGLRAIRFSLHHHDIFQQQLRAVLRAGVACRNLRIMFPMITSLDEFRTAKLFLDDCMIGLKRDGFPYHPDPMIGVMIEVPSVLEIIDDLAAEADFLSIGTNDFVQYMLAVDRTNDKVAEYYQPFHPAVLRSLAKISAAAEKAGKQLSICGELAHETDYIPFLVGIGIRDLSVYPKFLPPVQKTISQLAFSKAKALADTLLSQSTIKGVKDILHHLNNEAT